MQYFKGDDLEKKFENVAKPILDVLSLQKDLFFSGAYSAYPLGDVIFNSGRSPLSNAIDDYIFRTSFNEIFEGFTLAGSFESYISVFKKIFGTSAVITFVVPAPGKLQIYIQATEVETSTLDNRNVQNNAYVFYTTTDNLGNEITVQTIKGFQSQYELEQMLFEMVPAGIFTQIYLTLGV